MRRRRFAILATVLTGAGAATAIGGPIAAAGPVGHHLPRGVTPAGLAAARAAEPVVITGAQVPAWSRAAPQGVANTYPGGTGSPSPIGDGVRSAHNGTLVVPPDPLGRTGVDPNRIAAFSWTGTSWKEIPVQVDRRIPYFLANGHSSFSFYSGTDEELTYVWAPDPHDYGEESWKMAFGTCAARYADSAAEVAQAEHDGVVSPEPSGSLDNAAFGGYGGPMTDPVPGLDDADEISFMAGDAGAQAPATQAPPPAATDGQVVSLTDPFSGAVSFVYLFLTPHGSSFTYRNGYVSMTRDADSYQWVDRYSFSPNDPQRIGTSNTGYGPNLAGTVCVTAPDNDATPRITTPDGQPRPSIDRQPRDGMTVKTATYEVTTNGRWLVNGLYVTRPGTTYDYGPNVISRWKGRAFQQTPDSSVSLVGFEDEQTNWEMNSALLGWRVGPVRAIREVWGADSGTNVTKSEYYYRDSDVFAFHVRVHPIPPDGLYTDWDYRPGIATTYYNLKTMNGVSIDGQPDNLGEVDRVPVTGQNASIDTCDPTFQICSAIDNPEEVAGPGFGLVYEFELTSPTAAAGNFLVLPYYRDDACFDDGTGDAPMQRPYPGEASTSVRVQQGYLQEWQAYYQANLAQMQARGWAEPASYGDLKCQPQLAVHGDPFANPTVPPWQIMPFQGAIGEHGVHFLFTQDSDNAFGPKPVDEIDGQQWRFEVPMAAPTNVLVPYGLDVSAKLVAAVIPAAAPGAGLVPEVPLAAAIPALGAAIFGFEIRRRRRDRGR